ncbi:CcmD family protein [Chloroflexales bacterium ZM16-3]|nr:CcmD family protein [Chloroflexales bacterium ZM16-3]
MNVALDAGAAVYVAMAVTLSVWIGIFAYLWRIDSQARALKRELEREERREQPVPPRATITRVREGEPVEK